MNKLLSVGFFFWMNVSLLSIASEIMLNSLDEARSRMVTAQSKFLKKKMTQDDFDNLIYLQSGIIAREKAKSKNQDIIMSPEKTSLDDNSSSIKKALMAWSGYEVTGEQKNARRHFDILLEQRKIVKDEYDLSQLDDEISAGGKEALKTRYDNIIKRVEAEIYKQQVAIGSRWSLLKKAVITASVAAAAMVVGLLFTNTWWNTKE